MKRLKTALSVLLALVTAVVCLAVPASAAGNSGVIKWDLETNIGLRAQKDKKSVAYLKFRVEGAGILSFYFSTSDSKLTKASTYELISSKNKTLNSGRLSSLATKKIRLSKGGTYYLKVSLAKGERIKYFRYYFYAYGAKVTATDAWLKDYTPSDDDLLQMVTAFKAFLWLPDSDQFFDEGEINEHQALDWVVESGLGFLNPYGFDTVVDENDSRVLTAESREGKDLGGYSPYATIVLPEKAVDDTLYHLFGITATHKVNNSYKYYYDGYYYYAEGAKGMYDKLEYVSVESASDGRFIVRFIYHKFDFENSDFDDPKYIDTDVYALCSVHETDGKNYTRIHGIYNGEKPEV